MIKLQVREVKEKDLSFIYATWLHSYQHNSYHAKKIRNSVFYKNHQRILKSIIEDPETKIAIATPEDDSEVILGYFVYSPPEIVHFIYVKKNFRNFKIADTLVKSTRVNLEICSFSHWCLDTNWIVEKYPSLTYNPYLALFKETI